MPKKPKKLVDRDSLGEALHTALRKCCDSKPTSLLWNIFSEIDGGVWAAYLEHIWVLLQVAQKGGVDPGEYWKVLKDAPGSFEHDLAERRDRKIEWSWVHMMLITFEYFTDDDWQRYAAFLTY